jgi:hypothetical protein
MRGRPRLGPGVTLLELILAITLIAVLLGMAMPRMAGMGRLTKLRGAAREVAGLLRQARATAVFGEIEVDVRFSPEEGKYTMNYDPVELEMIERRGRRGARRSGRPDRGNRRMEELIRRQSVQWLRVRELPADRQGRPDVVFAAVETEREVASSRNRHDLLPAVIFYPDGTSTTGTIVLESRSGARLSIEVHAATGNVTVSAGDLREREEELHS